MIFYDYVSVFYLIWVHLSKLSSYGKYFWSFRRKMEKTRSVKEEMDGLVFISFVIIMIKVLFPT